MASDCSRVGGLNRLLGVRRDSPPPPPRLSALELGGMVMSIPVVRHGSSIGSAVLNPRPLAVEGSGPITCERKAMLLNEWAIDPALFC